jgi:hypothetical protein
MLMKAAYDDGMAAKIKIFITPGIAKMKDHGGI